MAWPWLVAAGISAVGGMFGASKTAGATEKGIESQETMFRQAAEIAAQEENWKRQLWYDREVRLQPYRELANSMLYMGQDMQAPDLDPVRKPPAVTLPWQTGGGGGSERPADGYTPGAETIDAGPAGEVDVNTPGYETTTNEDGSYTMTLDPMQGGPNGEMIIWTQTVQPDGSTEMVATYAETGEPVMDPNSGEPWQYQRAGQNAGNLIDNNPFGAASLV